MRGTTGSKILLAAGKSKGLSDQTILAKTGLNAGQIFDAAQTISYENELQIALNLFEAANQDPVALGFDVSRHVTFGDLGIWGYSLITSGTYGDAVNVGLRYAHLSPAYVIPTVTRTESQFHIGLNYDHLPVQLADFLVARDICSIPLLIDATGIKAIPLTLGTRFSGRQGSIIKEALAGYTVHTGQSEHRVSANNDILSTLVPTADPITGQLCVRECERLSADSAIELPVAEKIREILLKAPDQMPSLEKIATDLHLSPRTVRRKLTEQDTSYRQLKDEVCCTVAIELLSVVGLPVNEVAERLGFSDSSSFAHAFKRWTGRPARDFITKSAD